MVFFFQNYSCASKWRTKWGKTCFNYNVAEKIACVLIKRACQWFSVLEEERGWKKKGSLEQKREKKEVELTWTWIIGLWLRPCPGVVGLNKMGAETSGCGRCARFLTDREQRKVNKRIQHRWRFQSIGYSLSIIKRFGVWASSMCSPSQFFLSCLLSALSGWVQSHCFFHFCQNV